LSITKGEFMTKINEATAAKKLWQYMRLLRVHQYVKNFFIFLPAFFAIRIIDFEIVRDATLAFVSFSFVASSIYIFNDLRDRKSDKLHPSKKFRPLITGEVSINLAVLFLFLLAFSGFFIGYFFLNSKFVVILIIYLTINVVYSLGGKHIAILDLLFISSGFVLRLLAGTHYGAIDRVFPSKWIIIMTFLLAMFIAFAKRRSDVLIKNQDHIKTRKSIDGYNLEFINAAMSIMAAVIIVAYILYTISPEAHLHYKSDNIYMSTVFVVTGVLRYFQITLVYNLSGSPSIVLIKDHFLKLTIASWLIFFAVLAYF